MLEKLLWRQIARLPPIEDRLGDIRREIAEADEAGEVGPANTFALGECSKGDAFGFNPIEPPWYGPVCPVVWEGWRREASPYPDQFPFYDSAFQNPAVA